MAENYEITGQIEEVRPSQSGKTMGAKVNGTWYSTKSFGITQHVGQNITGKCSDSEFNGKTMHWLNEYTLAAGVNPPAYTPPAQQAAPSQGAFTTKDRSIITQSLAKAVLSPDMTDEQIRARMQFLWALTEEMELWAKLG